MRFADFEAAELRELDRQMERHQRVLELARHNGYEIDLADVPHLPGVWWKVPIGFEPIAGCMLARIQ